MKKIKAVIQNDSKDCGVCSISYIVNYYGGYVPMETIREDTYTNNLGTNFYHMMNALKKYGFDVTGVLEKNISSDKLTFPFIAQIKFLDGYEHFVVVNNIKHNYVYLMDPGRGYVKEKINEFLKLFTGNVLLIYPRSNIIKYDECMTIYELFSSMLLKEKSLIIKIIITLLIFTLITILGGYYLKMGSNLLSLNSEYLKYLIIVFGLFIFIKLFCSYMKDYYQNHLNNLLDVRLYPSFINHILSVPLNSIKNRTTGEVITRIGNVASIKMLFTDLFITVLVDLFLMLGALIMLFCLNGKLSFILLSTIIIYSFYGYLISKRLYKKILENINYETEFNSVITEIIEMIESIKNLNISTAVLKKVEIVLSKYLFNNYKFNTYINRTNLIKDIIVECSLFIINSVGFYYILKGQLTIVNLFTFNLILAYCIDPVKNIVGLLPKYNFVKATFNKIQEFINIKEEIIKNDDYILKGDIVFNNCSFSYNNYDYIFENVNFTVKCGEHVLIDGPSGVGKSTICKIIYKETLPNKGSVLIDDKNIVDLSLGSIRNSILYVGQNEKLFTGTIKENIVVNRKISEEEFFEVIKICELESVVKTRPLRFDSFIEATFNNLSGGEVQRIILARGLLKKANIIILDESLSEVNIKLEEKIISNIREKYYDKTIIYVSHKNHKNMFSKIIKIGGSNELL